MGVPLVRVMSYNIRSLRDDSAAVVRVIRAADPDVVCVQEAPRFLFWRRKCARLARDVGMRFADLDVFNLSFTPPAAINALHRELFSRLPRHRIPGRADLAEIGLPQQPAESAGIVVLDVGVEQPERREQPGRRRRAVVVELEVAGG